MLGKLSAVAAIVLILTFFCGCSDVGTAEKRLANELKTLAARYVKNEFARQIRLNSQCKAFKISDNKLLLLGFDGVEVTERTLPHNELHEFAVARYYAGQELDIKCNTASWSNLTAIEHERYSYRALVTFNFTDSRRMWQHVPGNSIVVTDFKNKSSATEIKNDLLDIAAKNMPDEKFDYYAIFTRSSAARERKFSVSVFVRYDSSLPGWVPEEDGFGEVKLDAVAPDWLECSLDKFKPVDGMELYKDDLYWRNSKLIRKNYDEGLVLFRNKWMPQAEAEENIRFDELVRNFEPDRADINQLTAFLQAVKAFSEQIDPNTAWQKAVECAENHINNLRNADKYRELESFYDLIQKNPAYEHIVSQLQAGVLQAISTVKRRINRQLDNQIDEIKNALKNISDLNSGRNFTPNQINIECVRQDNKLKKICPQDAGTLSKLIFQIRFILLLKKRDIGEVNKLYKYSEYKDELRLLEKAALADCKNCRKGLQKCIYCEKAPGICSDCEGKRPISGEVCSSCKGYGRCVHCRGRASMKCMNCQGRNFIILSSNIEEYCNKVFLEFEKILKNNIIELEEKKLSQ